MQVDGYFPNLGQADLPPRHWIGFELRKQHRLHLSKLLEAWKAKSSKRGNNSKRHAIYESLFAKPEREVHQVLGTLSLLWEVHSAECNRWEMAYRLE